MSVIFQFLDLIWYARIHVFFIFFCVVWTLWFIKCHYARQNKPYIQKYNGSASVVIPVYNEKPEVFERCLISIIKNKPQKIIVVMDRDAWDPKIEKIVKNHFQTKLICNPKRGKRPALIEGAKKCKSDIIVFVDCDTIFPDGSLTELLKPFCDEKVGGATIKNRIFNREQTVIRRFSDWLTNSCFQIAFAATSSKGVLVVLPGRALAIRRTLLNKYIPKFLNDTYRGNPFTLGDDRCLTSCLLKDRYKTVLQPTATVYTDSPNTIRGFIKQQLRWYRSNQKYNFEAFRWMFSKHWLYPLHILAVQFIPYIFLSVCLYTVFNVFTGFYLTLSLQNTVFNSFPALIFVSSLGMNTSIGLRQSPHLTMQRDDLKYLPLFVLFVNLFVLPTYIYATFTIKNQKWLTR